VQPTACAACDAWLASLYSTPGLNPAVSGAVESVQFAIPPGFGPAAEVLVVVDGVPSDANATFVYDAPVITNLAPNRFNLTQNGSLNLIIEGSSFCATQACGVIRVNNETILPTSWSHSYISCVVPDPQSSVPQAVQIVVGGVASPVAFFLKPVPFFSGQTQVRQRTGEGRVPCLTRFTPRVLLLGPLAA